MRLPLLSLCLASVVFAQGEPASSPALTTARAFEAAWNKHAMEEVLKQVSDNATFTWVVDPTPAPGKVMPDVSFSGHEEIRAFLESDLPGFHLEAADWKAEADRVTGTPKLRSEGFKRLGADAVDANLDLIVGNDGKISSLTLALTKESSAKVIPEIPKVNKAVIRRFYEQLNRKNMGVIDELVSGGFIQHASIPTGAGRSGLKTFFGQLRSAFPDFNFTIDDMIAEGDRVAIRMTCRYTHKGTFMGVAPTGKAVVLMKMDVMRFVNGKIVEHWDAADRLGLLQQLGVVPKLPMWEASPGYEGFR
jgi:steroid delta-isomerase-like uncharacterized protein